MLHITKHIALGLGLCLAVPSFSQQRNSDPYEMISETAAAESSIAAEIAAETDRIVALTKEMAGASKSKQFEVKQQIESCQKRIAKLIKALPAPAPGQSLDYKRYDFDVADNSLALGDFSVDRNGTTRDFDLYFATGTAGVARVDIISPGGELLDTFSSANFKGKMRETVKLSSAPGTIYFVHISIGDQSVTKKVRFS